MSKKAIYLGLGILLMIFGFIAIRMLLIKALSAIFLILAAISFAICARIMLRKGN